MPKIGKKKYPYTKEGMKKFKADKKIVQQGKRGQSSAEIPATATSAKKKKKIGKK